MLAVHVDQPPGAGAFVQVVDILGDDQQVAGPVGVEPRQRLVRRVRDLGLDRLAPRVVEAVDEVGIARESLGRRDVLDPMLLPQPARVAEGVDAAFGRNPGAGQDHDILDGVMLSLLRPPNVIRGPFSLRGCEWMLNRISA